MQLTTTTNKSAENLLDRLAKRTFDLAAATVMLLLTFPLWLVIIVLIRLDSQGGAFFTQERIGARRNRLGRWEPRPFTIIKFRTMTVHADESVHKAHITAYVNGALPEDDVKLNGDARVTKIGRILRQTSLDELPQLLNILRGEMSFVGPRPVPVYEVDAYETWHHERLHATPGLTGFWQVNGRGRVSFDEQVQMDIDYVRQRNFWLDIKLFLQTIPAVLRGKGAR